MEKMNSLVVQKGGIASFVTNLFSSQKSDKNQSSHKDTGFFIVKDFG